MVEKLLLCEHKIVSFQFHNHAVFVAHGDKRHSGFGRTVAFVKYFKYVVLPILPTLVQWHDIYRDCVHKENMSLLYCVVTDHWYSYTVLCSN